MSVRQPYRSSSSAPGNTKRLPRFRMADYQNSSTENRADHFRREDVEGRTLSSDSSLMRQSQMVGVPCRMIEIVQDNNHGSPPVVYERLHQLKSFNLVREVEIGRWFKPGYLDSYELSYRSTWLNKKLSFNANVF